MRLKMIIHERKAYGSTFIQEQEKKKHIIDDTVELLRYPSSDVPIVGRLELHGLSPTLYPKRLKAPVLAGRNTSGKPPTIDVAIASRQDVANRSYSSDSSSGNNGPERNAFNIFIHCQCDILCMVSMITHASSRSCSFFWQSHFLLRQRHLNPSGTRPRNGRTIYLDFLTISRE